MSLMILMKMIQKLWLRYKCPSPISIRTIMQQCFQSWKQYAARIEYHPYDYQNHKIPWTLKTFRRTIIITFASAVNISFLITLVIGPEMIGLPISLNDMDHILHVNECRILAIYAIFTLLILEYMWLGVFRRILRYECRVNDIFIEYSCHDNNCHYLCANIHRYFTRFILIANIFSGMIYRLLTAGISIVFILIVYGKILSYLHSQIHLLNIILFILIAIFVYIHTSYTFGQLFISMKYLLFMIEFFRLQSKQLLQDLLEIVLQRNTINHHHYRQQRHCKQIIINEHLIWQQFYRNYVKLYDDTSKLNCSLRAVFLSIEMISKCSIIFSSIFYGQQIHWNIFNSMFVLLLMCAFHSNMAIYSRVSLIPSYNEKCWHYLCDWNARKQYYLQCRRNQLIINNNHYPLAKSFNHHTIHLNLFIQTISMNQFGMTCGQAFFITKYKYTQLFLLNFSLILLFYKKICLL